MPYTQKSAEKTLPSSAAAAAFGLLLVVLSIVFWRILQQRDLAGVRSETAAKARSYSSEAESRYNSIYHALARLADRGMPRELQRTETDDWGQDATFYMGAFRGIRSIAWVDTVFRIQRTVPTEIGLIGENAHEVDWGPSAISIWVPVYRGAYLDGFVVGVVGIPEFMSPVLEDIRGDYMVQIEDEGTVILSSGNWGRPTEAYTERRMITLRYAAVWNLTLAATEQLLYSQQASSRMAFTFSLFLSLMTTVTVFFAQRYDALSKLNALRFRRMLESMHEGCEIIGTDWRYLFVNDTAAARKSLSKEELLGRTVVECEPGIEDTELYALLQRCMAGQAHQVLLDTVKLADGSTSWYELSVQPAPDGVLILSSNVTERERAHEAMRNLNTELDERVRERTAQLQSANKELEAFSYSVSHDLRAPLRAVDGFVQILLEDYGAALDDEGKRVCSVISESAKDMGKLIDALLAFSRVGRAVIAMAPIDMAALAQSVFLERTTPSERERIDFAVGPLPVGLGDPTLIRQVWANLIGNATKFSAKKERAVISISGESQGELALYTIEDNGAGFDMQYVNKLFGVFQRLHSAKDYQGTGAGLAIVQRIVRRHGGTVWAEGSVDHGATFRFTLGRGD